MCADDSVVAVSEFSTCRISVFRRSDGALLRRFGTYGSRDGQLALPHGLCFMNECCGHCDQAVIAVADRQNWRISVFCIGGEFLRHVGAGDLGYVNSIACSAFGELVASDDGNDRVVLFGVDGKLSRTMDLYICKSVAIHGGAVYAQSSGCGVCVVFT